MLQNKIKRFFKSTATLLCTAAVLMTSMPLAADASAITAKTTDYLNLRQGAGTNTRVILTLGRNVSVTILDNTNSQWARVRTSNGTTGYCFKQYLSTSGSSQSSGSSSSQSTAVTTVSLNMRTGPSLSSGIIAILSRGSSLKVIDNSNSQWTKVQTQNGKQGWCYKSYLKIPAASNPTPVPTTPTNTSSGATATTTDYLNLREGAGTGYRVILTLGKGISASVLDNSNSAWVKVLTASGKQGWCSRQYLKISGTVPPSSSSNTSSASSSGTSSGSTNGNNGSQGTDSNNNSNAVTGASVTADLLRLRASASTSSSILDNLPCGTYLKVLDTSQSGWVKVQTSGGKTGYVCSDYVKLLYGDDHGSQPTGDGAVTISASSQSIPQGKTLWLKAATNPSGVSVSWTSSNTSVATVVNGYVYAVAPGTAQIKASTATGSASCSVAVTAAEPIRATYASPNIAAPGESVAFTAVTDTARNGVEFSITMADGSKKTLKASSCKQETTNGITTKVWTGSTSFSKPGTYSYTAYSSVNGVFSTNGVSSSAMVATQGDFTATSSEQRRVSDKMLNLISKWEGCSSEVYADQLASSQIPTIGYGCTLGTNAVFYNNISQTEAWAMLVNKVNNSSYTSELNRMITNNHFLMSQNQADCLISFAYNVGSRYFNSSDEMDFRRIMKNAVVPPTISSGSSIAATVTYDTSLRENHDLMSNPICQISSGTSVSVTAVNFSDKKNGWYQVRLSNGTTGWINSGYVNLSNSGSLVHDLNYTNAYAFGTELILWNQAGGNFYTGLFYRRLGEANVYNYNDYSAARYNKYNYTYPTSASSLE